jgi:amino acid transporter
MTKNMGTADRVVRTLIALAIAVLYFTGKISGTLAIILGIVAIAFVLTSLVGWCPSYVPFRLSTRKPSNGASTTP